MAWTAINNSISLEIIVFYLSAIFWTLGYDTIYGAQDMSDDEIIGLKSTSIKFKKNINYLLVLLIILISSFIFIFLKKIGKFNLFLFFIFVFY